jgi:hypothetical protein
MTEECNLDEVKKEYSKFKDKYNLPSFDEVNEVFEIEDIDTETDFFLRRIRRLILDKVVGYMRFIEIMLNPSNATIFFFKLTSKLEKSDKEALTEMYERIGKFEIDAIKIDLDYSEEKEAELIKDMFNIFKTEIKEKLLPVIYKLENGKEEKKKDDSGYFG